MPSSAGQMLRRAMIPPTPSACMPVATRCSRRQAVLLLLIRMAIPVTLTAQPLSQDRPFSLVVAGAGEAVGAGAAVAGTDTAGMGAGTAAGGTGAGATERGLQATVRRPPLRTPKACAPMPAFAPTVSAG